MDFFPNILLFKMFLQFLPKKKSINPHSSDQLFFFFDRWHVLTSKLADISRWLGMDSKVTICCNMLHRLRQRPSAFKGHRVARGGINKGDATYVGMTASSRGLRHPLAQTHNCAGWKLQRKRDTGWMRRIFDRYAVHLRRVMYASLNCF